MGKLSKVTVSTGVFWVEIPEAKVCVLCGCPADSVKFLMKRGLIRDLERGGASFETGPNVILLSDVLIQNGSFCNLAEFPVLQMLYRQGMILPGHPNNTGAKPMLVGRADQVTAQLNYIHRGNYGLISRRELMDAGLDEAAAHEAMRLKLAFAFGRIRDPEELIDARVLDAEPIEIGSGVILRRLAPNRFEFAYGGDSVEVDLTLGPNETYEAPYPLGAHAIRREYFGVVHSGEGDGWDPERPSMASILMFQGGIYLIDAGPNIQASLTALGIGLGEVEGIFHTHCHDDHFAGLATLLRCDRRMKYFATPPVRASVVKKLAALIGIHEDLLGDYFEFHDLVFDNWNDVDGIEVMPLRSPHPVETNIFLFRSLWAGGYRTYAHFADIAAVDVLENMLAEEPDKPGLTLRGLDKVLADYALPADVKKLDIGGGMIHGKVRDFVSDRSGKLILAHTARPLTNEEKAVGSGAPFGTVDVLIPASQDYVWAYAADFLRDYFPDVPPTQLAMLMNSPKIPLNPETILIREGMPTEAIYLVLTGEVEVISTATDVRNTLSAGALLGELTGLHGLPAMETCRTASFVEALRFPCDLYLEFV
ncbi:MAG: cyclic nucleotide-binding domain-containing protein, partial [Rhodospirillales bacterium]|nr:cyclic nucleotide-binding domain-containing protein [Rhodospirillales bacterium]